MSKLLYLLLFCFSCIACQPQLESAATTAVVKANPQPQKISSFPYKLEKETFSALFPAAPNYHREEQETSIGSLQLHQYSLQVDTFRNYILSYTDYPKEALKKGNKRKLLGQVKQSILKAFKIRASDSEGFMYKKKYPALRFSGKQRKEGYSLYYQLVLKEQRLYQQGVLNSKDTPQEAHIDSFMNGLELPSKPIK
jgi:hypothetical protein